MLGSIPGGGWGMTQMYPKAFKSLGIAAQDLPPVPPVTGVQAFQALLDSLPGLFFIHPTARPAVNRILTALNEAVCYEAMVLKAYQELEDAQALDIAVN